MLSNSAGTRLARFSTMAACALASLAFWQAARAVDVDVAALQVTQPFPRIEPGPPMQQPAVVEHDEIAAVEQKAQLEFGGAQQLIEHPARAIIGRELVRR